MHNRLAPCTTARAGKCAEYCYATELAQVRDVDLSAVQPVMTTGRCEQTAHANRANICGCIVVVGAACCSCAMRRTWRRTILHRDSSTTEKCGRRCKNTSVQAQQHERHKICDRPHRREMALCPVVMGAAQASYLCALVLAGDNNRQDACQCVPRTRCSRGIADLHDWSASVGTTAGPR
jgi:hypothetical protein